MFSLSRVKDTEFGCGPCGGGGFLEVVYLGVWILTNGFVDVNEYGVIYVFFFC